MRAAGDQAKMVCNNLQLSYCMSDPLYAGLEAYAQLEVSTRHLRLVPCCPHDEFSESPAERLPYAHRAHPGPFI